MRVLRESFEKVYRFASYPFGFEGGIWDLIVLFLIIAHGDHPSNGLAIEKRGSGLKSLAGNPPSIE